MADKWFTYISELAKLAQAEVTKSSEHWQNPGRWPAMLP